MFRCWAGTITVLALAVAASQADANVLFSNSVNGLSASASFTVSRSAGARQLTILLTNTDDATGLNAPVNSAHTLTGLFFNLGTSTFTPKSAKLEPNASIIQTVPCHMISPCVGETNVRGEFSDAFSRGNWLPDTTTQGIASIGYLNENTDAADFNGSNWEGPAALVGINFGMVPDGWMTDANQGLGKVALIEGIVKFVLDIPEGLAQSAISNVNFTYGR